MRTNEPSTDTPQGPATLVRHEARPEWGDGIFIWEKGERRAYQFENGGLRLFSQGYYDLLKPVDRPAPVLAATAARLRRRARLAMARRQGRRTAAARGEEWLGLQSQITFFQEHFPEGFSDPEWKSEVRGDGAPRTLKKHRLPVLEAAKAISPEAIAAAVKAKKTQDIFRTAGECLDMTDLVSPALRDVYEEADPAAVVSALHDLVTLEQPAHECIDRLSDELGGHWRLVTVLPALSQPQLYVPVRRTTFGQAAKWLAPNLEIPESADGVSYIKILEMAQAVYLELRSADLEPADLIDVHDFICYCMKPAHRKAMAARG